MKKFILTVIMLLVSADLFAAATRFSVMNFRFSPDGGEYFNTVSSTSLYQLQWQAGTMIDYSKSIMDERTTSRKIIDYMIQQQFFGAVGLLDWLDVGFNLPVAYINRFAEPDVLGSQLENKMAIGDPLFTVKARILDRAKYPVGLAIEPYAFIPIGKKDYFMGNDGFSGGGRVVLDTEINRRLWLSLNVGAEAHKSVNWRNINLNKVSLTLGAGASVRATDSVYLVAEGFTRTPTNDIFKARQNCPSEIVGGVKWNIGKTGVQVNAGGGAGIIRGAGAPKYRGFGGVTYEWMNERIVKMNEDRITQKYVTLKEDKDVMGLVTLREKCPVNPADYKAGVDDEGCPKYYELKDVADLVIKCPKKPEDFNPKIHSEQCQKVYTLKSNYNEEDVNSIYMMTTVELADKCPDDPAKFNPKIDDQACPKYYELRDITPLIASCPKRPEDFNPKIHDESCQKVYTLKDSYQDEGWMTIAKLSKKDTDNDTIPDIMDKCPKVFGLKEFQGCPAPKVPSDSIRVTGAELTTKIPVLFKFDSYQITDEAAVVLGQVAEQLIAHPEIKSITIEGYADVVGEKVVNKVYSKNRAEAVKRYLELHGVDSSRLKTVWYGPSTKFGVPPKNRRVIFTIER